MPKPPTEAAFSCLLAKPTSAKPVGFFIGETMSYSFSIRAATKAAAILAVAAAFDQANAQQPCHKLDREQALGAATSFINLLPEDDTRDVAVSMNGYVSGTFSGNELTHLQAASVTVSAALVQRQETAAA